MAELVSKEEVFQIVGAAMAVFNELGHGFLEAVYQEALCIEFANRAIAFSEQVPHRIQYRGQLLTKQYIADFVCHSCVLVELKATASITPLDEAQVINYLKATGLRVAVILNFGKKDELEWRRYVL